MYLRLALNCLCSPGWPETLDASVFLLLGHATMSGSQLFFQVRNLLSYFHIKRLEGTAHFGTQRGKRRKEETKGGRLL